MGVPAKVTRPVKVADMEFIDHNAKHYVELARDHVENPGRWYR
jgi:carbonic anhydrase/acetyltransferase-like protein (isoleucine patch superfamily)